jgi:hypothetical protein
MGILESGGEGGMKVLDCRVIPGPTPAGATAPRLLSTSWDALQSKGVRVGPLVDGCVIESAGDDSWSVHSEGFVFRNNRIRSSGRGALVKSSNGLIENNCFENAHAAVVVCPEKSATTGLLYRQLVIRNNIIRESGVFCPAPWSSQAGAISVTAAADHSHLRPAGAFEDITIEGNIFEHVCGVNIVVSSTRGLRLLGNRFTNPDLGEGLSTGHAYGIDQQAVIWLSDCEDVKLEGNNAPATFRKP